MYQRILVAADGSPWSDAALAYAIRLASFLNVQLCILTVPTTPLTYAVPDMMGSVILSLIYLFLKTLSLMARQMIGAKRAGT